MAMEHIREDVVLNIFGEGPDLKRLKKIVNKRGLERRIAFLGAVNHTMLRDLLKEHDFFMTASDMETQGLAALEAAASGLPIICVDRLAVQEIVDGNGYVVKTGDHMAMAACANRLYTEPGLIEKMGIRSRQIAEMHDMEKTGRQLLSLYDEMVSRKR